MRTAVSSLFRPFSSRLRGSIENLPPIKRQRVLVGAFQQHVVFALLQVESVKGRWFSRQRTGESLDGRDDIENKTLGGREILQIAGWNWQRNNPILDAFQIDAEVLQRGARA